ncbi:MAG: hypothetical protein ACRYFX_30015 [Janthinobacterium lividum]
MSLPHQAVYFYVFILIYQAFRSRFSRAWFLVVVLLAASGAGRVAAQVADDDSTQRATIFERRRLVVQVDTRFSIINSHFCTINGLKLGLEWRGRIRTGAAFYFLSSRIPTHLEPPDNAANNADATLRFYNVALYGEYILLENNRWELGANLQTGLGSLRVEYTNEDYNRERSPRDFIGLVEPSVAAQMRLFSWVSLGAGAGWRQPLFVTPLVRNEISGPIFYLRGKVLLGPMWHIIRRHKPLFSQEGIRVRGLNQQDRRKFYGQ